MQAGSSRLGRHTYDFCLLADAQVLEGELLDASRRFRVRV
jgi:hypothetical protein